MVDVGVQQHEPHREGQGDGEALAEAYTQVYDNNGVLIGVARSDYQRPFNPVDALRYNPIDEDGWLRITGRVKDMVIRGGENIYPREIEEYLYQNPKIVEAQVFGVPDDKYGEELAVWIRLRDGELATEQEIRDYCNGKIAHYKIPRYIRFVDEFPMTVTGKIQKFQMRDTMIEELGLADRETA